jgi:FkbM family methyltransferase
MVFEDRTLAALRPLLPPRGLCIEAGVGNSHWYWQSFVAWGYPTLAIDPLPSAEVVDICRRVGVAFWVAALSDRRGVAPLYTRDEPDDWSTLEAYFWTGLGRKSRPTPTITLRDLLEDAPAEALPPACLKLDIEGHEWRVLRSLTDLPRAWLPAALCFEYGGGGLHSAGQGGWSAPLLANTLTGLAVCQQLGYERLTLIDEGLPEPVTYDLQAQVIQERLFPAACKVGNALVSERKR